MLTRIIAMLALLLAAPALAEEVVLKWKAGDRFSIATESKTMLETKTTHARGEPVTQTETLEEKIVRQLTVESVDASGGFAVIIDTQSIDSTSTAPGRSTHYLARREENDQKHVEVSIKSMHAMMAGRDVKLLMEKLASNLLDVRIKLRVSPRGEVTSASVDGKPFANLPAETPVTKSVQRIMKRLVKVDDLPASIAAEAFPILPGAGAKIGESWPVSRSLSALGVALAGTGTGVVTSVESAEGRPIATLKESLTYRVDVTAFNASMRDLIEEASKLAKRPTTIELSFKGRGDVKAEAVTQFDITGGHSIATTWSDLKIPLGGTCSFTVEKETTTVEIEVVATVTSKNTWTKQ